MSVSNSPSSAMTMSPSQREMIAQQGLASYQFINGPDVGTGL